MAVPTNLAEALTLLTFSGGDQITGQDVRDVITWLAQPRAASAYFPTGVASVDTPDVEARLNSGEHLVLYGTLLLDRPIVITLGGGALISSPELPATIGQAPAVLFMRPPWVKPRGDADEEDGGAVPAHQPIFGRLRV